jgi:radical SAM protein with 4Fe4S-binding SPASM domain
VALELTAACNQKCDYCYNEWREDGGAHVATGGPSVVLARVRRILDTFDVNEFTVTGGEPFLRPDLFDILGLIRARGSGVHIISNGGLVTRPLAERIAKHGVSFVQITLNGPDRELHEAHVGPDHFDATLAGIRALTEAGVTVVGCIVVTRKNAARLGEILELFASLSVRNIALSRFSPAGYATRYAAELLPSRPDLLEAFTQAAPFVRERGMSIRVTMPVPPCALEVEQFPELIFGSCPIGTSLQEFALSPDGKLRHCTLHRSSLAGGRDVLDPELDLAALVASREVTEYRRTLPEFCRGCAHAETCGGGCGAAAEWVLGSRHYPDPFVFQHVDPAFAGRLDEARGKGRVRLEVVH